MPVTTPVAAFTLAMVVSLLLHVPPVVESLREIVEPTHTADAPLIDGTYSGPTFTVIDDELGQEPTVEVTV